MQTDNIEEFLRKQKNVLDNDRTRLTSECNEKDPDPRNSSHMNENDNLSSSKSTGKQTIHNVSKNKTKESFSSSYNTIKDSKNSVNERKLKKSHKKDSDEWITDTFFQYFPSFNDNERKKRENLTQARVYDYQNFLQTNSSDITSPSSDRYKTVTSNTAQSDNSNKMNSKNDKTEMEIIVNNPDFKFTNKNKPSSKIPHTYSTRDKLLQDLTHIGLSNMFNSNAIQERNRYTAEEEAKNKKEYCKDLMKQIEEKRQEVKILKEKEKWDDEVLTKKQLHEVQHEKEEMAQQKNEHYYPERRVKSENGKHEENKVYKYFSNSARHDSYHNRMRDHENNQEQFLNDTRRYNSEPPLSHRSINTAEILINPNGNENFYINNDENEMPLSPLSSCNTVINEKIYLNGDQHHYNQHHQQQHHNQGIHLNEINNSHTNFQYQYLLSENLKLKEFLSRILCLECEKLCTKCSRCNQKRNLCSNCVQNYCVNCGKSLKCITDADDIKDTGKITDRIATTIPTTITNSSNSSRINLPKIETKTNRSNKKQKSSRNTTGKSFQVLEISYSPDTHDNLRNSGNNDDDCDDDDDNDVLINEDKRIDHERNSSHNSSRNSDRKLADDIVLDKKIIDNDIEDIKKKTNTQLTKYLNNYGDLAVIHNYRRRSGSVSNTSSRISNENMSKSSKH